MGWTDDHTADVTLQTPEGPELETRALFSVWLNDHDDAPTLNLETVTLGGLHMRRGELAEWLGDAEVARIESNAAEGWRPYEMAYLGAAE